VTGPDPLAAPTGSGAPADPASIWRVATVVRVEMHLPSQYPLVVLQEVVPPQRQARIPVGLPEGTAIAYALSRRPTPRPLTHQLFSDVLDRHGVSVEAVRLTAVVEGNVVAELETSSRAGRHVVPCRPSDGFALALRRQPPVPIVVADWVLTELSGSQPG
jgi:bifunctional DNase/RNase